MKAEWIFETDHRTFQESVLERSKTVPVLVDFWASWCGPCRMLGPILEKVVNSLGGEVLLAKVNTDENPELAYQYGIQGIPAVKVFVDGRVVDEFVGALPEYEVRRFVQRWVKTEADKLAQQAFQHEAKQQWDEALKIYLKVLEKDPKHPAAWTGRLRVLVQLERLEEAEAVYRQLPAELAISGEVKVLQNKIEFLRLRKSGVSVDALKKRLETSPEDLETRYQLATLLAAHRQYREALEELLTILRKDRHFKQDAARQTMLKIFELAGARSPLAEEYREKLAELIF